MPPTPAATTTQGRAAPPGPGSGLRPYRITADVYERIAASGALGGSSRVILWDGQLVEKVADITKGRPHVTAVNQLDRLLGPLVAPGHFVEQEQPLELGPDRVPEPDLKVVRGGPLDYRRRTPGPADVPLVIEVADRSLDADQGEMLRGYAAAGIPVYWVVNLPRRRVDVYSGPGGPSGAPGYAELRSYAPGESAPVVLDGREAGRVAVDDILF